ncbi:histidine phosphatase superfamily [Mycena metata]|uniref:Histidine phosphatase superfamily n=1 Tax=Mycena metata TaxID=1033252 RepID=A0AAD7HPH7_9AGAR|nr:histidine phosphatase superfamily [Mycena metata]
MTSTNSTILGVVVLARHGDRAGFYQDPTTYTATGTVITPLGTDQELQLGQLLRSIYFNESSPSFISGLNTTLVDQNQIHVRADAGGELGVIYDSAVALLQGLFPANKNYTTDLANGTTVTGALGGYQYVPIESVEPTNDVSLEGYTSCAVFNAANTAFYNSTEFAQKRNESAAFLNQLPPFLDGRSVTLENMYNIYDFINVQSIHDASFAKALPPTFLPQAFTLASWHEYGVFSSPQLNGIGNIAGRAILPQILAEIASIANASDPLKIGYQSIAYKPFLSLFNMLGAVDQNPALAEIVPYAAAIALEVRQPSGGGEPVIRLNFKNGTGEDFVTYGFLNSTEDVPFSTLVNHVNPALINSTAAWCSVCQNTQDRGCGAIAAAAAQASAAAAKVDVARHQRLSNAGAGAVGAAVTLAVVVMMFGVLAFLGMLTVGRPRSKRTLKA